MGVLLTRRRNSYFLKKTVRFSSKKGSGQDGDVPAHAWSETFNSSPFDRGISSNVTIKSWDNKSWSHLFFRIPKASKCDRLRNFLRHNFLRGSKWWLWRWLSEMTDSGADRMMPICQASGPMGSQKWTFGPFSACIQWGFVRIWVS